MSLNKFTQPTALQQKEWMYINANSIECGSLVAGSQTISGNVEIKGNIDAKGDLVVNGNNFNITNGLGNVGEILSTDGAGNLAWIVDATGANDVAYTGAGATFIGEIPLYNSITGREVKESGVALSTLQSDITAKLNKAGDTMTGNLNMGGNNIITSGLVDGVDVSLLNSQVAGKVDKAGDTMTGTLTMSGAVIANSDGSAVAPSYTFSGDVKTGLYRTTLTPEINIAIDGKQLATINSEGIECKKRIIADSNSGTEAIYGFVDDPTSGITGGLGYVSIMNSGFNNYSFSSSEFQSNGQAIVYNTYPGCNLNKPQYSGNRTDSGLYMYPLVANGVSITNGGLEKMNFTSTENISLQPITVDSIDRKTAGTLTIGGTTASQINIGAVVSPVQVQGTLQTDIIDEKTPANGVSVDGVLLKDSSIDRSTAGTLAIGGTTQTALNLGRSSITTSNLGILANTLGSATNPSYTFTGDTDTGIYSQGADAISFTTAGVRKMAIGGITTFYSPIQLQPSNAGSNPITLQANSNDVVAFGTTTNYIMTITNSTNTITFNGVVSFSNGLRTNSITGASGTTLNIGTSISNAVSIGASGINTTINGNLYNALPHFDIYGGSRTVPMANATLTSAIPATPIKVNFGIDISTNHNSGFTLGTDGKATYTGTVSRMFHMAYTCSFDDDKNASLKFYMYKNGVLNPSAIVQTDVANNGSSIALHACITLNTNDYIELWCESSVASTTITAKYMNGFATALLNVP